MQKVICFNYETITMEIYFRIREIRFEYFLKNNHGYSTIRFEQVKNFIETNENQSPIFSLVLELLENELTEILL